jgi:glutamine amidotransferase
LKTGIIDYGAGNLRSVAKAVETLEFSARIIRSADQLEDIDTLILPGVGAFGDCVHHLREQGLWTPLREWIAVDKPYLGICLGYQILFDSSEEDPGVEGLGAFKGEVVRFPDSELKVPHMGWNEITPRDASDPLWQGLPGHPHVYFVHSYYPEPVDGSIVSVTADYGGQFAAGIRSGNVVATQFHPEKSQSLGLKILGNFLKSQQLVS